MNITDVLNAEAQNVNIPAFSKAAAYPLDESEVYQKFRLIANAIFAVEESDFATQDQKDFVSKLDLPVLARFKNTRYYKGLRALATDGFKVSILLDKNLKAEADQKACYTLKYGVLPGDAIQAKALEAGFAIKPYKVNVGSAEYSKLVLPIVNEQKRFEKQIDDVISKARKVSTNPEDIKIAVQAIAKPSVTTTQVSEANVSVANMGIISKKLN